MTTNYGYCDDGEDVFLAEDEQFLFLDFELGARVLGEQDFVALVEVDLDLGAVIEDAALPLATTMPRCGFSCAVSGKTMPLFVTSSRLTG